MNGCSFTYLIPVRSPSLNQIFLFVCLFLFWSRIIIRPKTVCSYFQGHYSRRPPSGTEIFVSGSSHLHLTYCSHLVLHLLGPNQHMAAHILLFTASHSVLSMRSIIHRHNTHICPPFTSLLVIFFFLDHCFYFCHRKS